MTKTIKNKKQNSSSKTKSRTKHRVSKLYGGAGPYEEQNNNDSLYNGPDKPEMHNNNNNSSSSGSHNTGVGSIAMKSPSTRIKISSKKTANSARHPFRGKVGPSPKHSEKKELNQKLGPYNMVSNNVSQRGRLQLFKNFIEELNHKKGLTFCDGKVILYYISMYFKNFLNTTQKKDIIKHMSSEIEQSFMYPEAAEKTFFDIVKSYIDLLNLGVKPIQNPTPCSFVNLKLYLHSLKNKKIYQDLFQMKNENYHVMVDRILRHLNEKYSK
jgi:hypothetical protein